MSKSIYGNYPRGCRLSNATTKNMVPVVLEDLALQGTRAQRRYAARELRKINNKAGGRP
jgi:hypothetical protein